MPLIKDNLQTITFYKVKISYVQQLKLCFLKTTREKRNQCGVLSAECKKTHFS